MDEISHAPAVDDTAVPQRIADATRPIVDPTRGWKRIGRSLRNSNYRLFFGGQFVSLIGTWMQQLALSWLVFEVTRDEFWMSLVSFTGQIPSLLLVPLAGVIIDRTNKLRLIIATQALLMVQATLLALLMSEHLSVHRLLTQVMILSFVRGCCNAFDMPGRQAFLPEMLRDRSDLANAIALNSSLFHGARMLGPALAALVLQWSNYRVCFWIDAVSYLAVLASLLMMKIPAKHASPLVAGSTGPVVPNADGMTEQPATPARPRISFVRGFLEGLSYAVGFPPIRAILVLVAITSLLGMPYTVLVPYFAGEIFHGNAATLGILMTASGIGALAGALYMASRPTVLGLGRKVVIGSLMFSIGLMLFSQTTSVWLAAAVLPFTGFGMMMQMASCNTILQTIVDDRMRGRVMSLYTMAFMGIAPFGILAAGALSKFIGAPYTLLIGGFGCLGGGLFMATQLPKLRQIVRPIYVAKGIMGEPE